VEGTAVRYGLDNSRIEYRFGRDLVHPLIPALGPTQPGLLPRDKAAGEWLDYPPISTADVKEKVELHL
jgi:hypothetical protein